MDKFKDKLSSLETFLSINQNVVSQTNDFSEAATAEEHPSFLKSDVAHNFYKSYKYGKLKWKLKESDEFDLRLTGSINMLPATEISKDWKDIVYFDSTPAESILRGFKPVDLFSDDACAGVFEADADNAMHLYLYEGEPTNLKLSIDNYLLMALSVKGFYFWQYLVQYFIDGRPNEVIGDYKSLAGSVNGLPPIDELKLQYDQLKQS